MEAIDEVGVVTDRSAWVVPLPKVELHVHLEGTMRPATVCDLSVERQGWSGALEPGWEKTYYTYTDFEGYMAQLTPRFPGRPDEYARIAREYFEELDAMNVIYAEVSFDGIVRKVGDSRRFWPIMEALEEARQEAETRYGRRFNYLIGLMRTLPPEVGEYRVRLAIEARERGYGVVGIDLHGDEIHAPAPPFAPAYQLARAAGLGLRAHAGEAAGPESVWAVLDLLRVHRVAHGNRAFEDPELLEHLRRSGVTLEICPTSNVRTGVVPTLAEHPITRFYQMGVPVTVNSDDPLPFFTSIEREYRLLVDELGFTREDLHVITRNAVNAAFVSARERIHLLRAVDTAYELPGAEAAS